MVGLWALVVPIILSAVIVFVASSILHMVLPYHRSDYTQIPNEEKLGEALRAQDIKPGLYVFPFCTPQNMKSPEAQERYKRGPVGMMTIVKNGPPNMLRYLGFWFDYCVIVSIFTAYLTGRTLPPGTNYLQVFRVAGCASFMAYGLSQLSNGIWKNQPWSMVAKEVFDGLIYGMLTAGTFGWLWPK